MDCEDRELAQAASQLTVQDFRYLEENDMLPRSRQKSSSDADQKASQNRTRRRVKHEWPEVGAILEADYKGQHYEAEVVPMPRLKSGKALKILTGPAAGKLCKSMSRAMLDATQKQREEQNLGHSGMANGWDFWSVKESSE